jgi:hypothetical protein
MIAASRPVIPPQFEQIEVAEFIGVNLPLVGMVLSIGKWKSQTGGRDDAMSPRQTASPIVIKVIQVNSYHTGAVRRKKGSNMRCRAMKQATTEL